jgi:OmpA-OmpF porin, OOP family
MIVLAGGSLFACSNKVPPRPIPPNEEVAEFPPWFPEEPWNKRTTPEKAYYFGKVVFDTAKPKEINIRSDEYYNYYYYKKSIRPASEKVLIQLLCYLQANPEITRIRLEGHTDSRASDEYNQALSERRAIAVADWLVDHGLDHNRIVAVAFGENRPIATNDNATGMQENRRTEFHVAEISGYWFRGLEPSNGGLVLTVRSRAEREAAARRPKPPVYKSPPVTPERDIWHEYPRTDPAIIKDKILKGEEGDPEAQTPEDGIIPTSLEQTPPFDASICAGVPIIEPSPYLYPHYPDRPKEGWQQ